MWAGMVAYQIPAPELYMAARNGAIPREAA